MPFERVLVTNDDGLDAPGLGALVAALAERHRVYVVAPDRERSGVSQAFTLFSPLRADEMPDRFPRGIAERVYRASGTPTDCVKLAMLELFADLGIDAVVSGINNGANMGPDVRYSGTVGGALEGVMNGRPSMAVSLVTLRGLESAGNRHPHFGTAADWAARLLGELEAELVRGRDEGYALNVNIGNFGPGEIQGWRFTDLARAHYDDRYVKHLDPSGRPHYWLEGDLVLEDERPDTDIRAVREAWVSVTPLSARISHRSALDRLGVTPLAGTAGTSKGKARKPSR